MTKTKSLISKLGSAFLIGATGLIGLTGCEVPQTQRQSIYQQPYQQSPYDENDGNLEMAILGGVLSAGLAGTILPNDISPMARATTEATTRGIGNGMLADATRPKTNVQVNVNGGYAQPSQPQVVLTPEQQEFLDKLLPEYDIAQLEKEWNDQDTERSYFLEGIYSIFTSRNAQDLNGDGSFDFSEFISVKRNFKKGEPIKLNVGYIARNGGFISNKVPATYKISFEILNEQGESVLKYESPKTQEKLWNSKALSLELPELKPGIYTAECVYSGKRPNKKRTIFQVLETE